MSVNWFKGYFILGMALPLLLACGPGSGKNPHPDDPLAQLVPYWVNITYTLNGQTKTLPPPFLLTQNIAADAATGSCTGNSMEILFNGSYNPDKVSKLVMTGVTSTATFSGETFTFAVCLAPGSASITITAYDKEDKAIRLPLTVSLHAMTSIKTLGFGHPRYPNTGFEVVAAGNQSANGTVVMTNTAAKKTTSTGNTGFTLQTGFVLGVAQ
jgi:hypothetical protein